MGTVVSAGRIASILAAIISFSCGNKKQEKAGAEIAQTKSISAPLITSIYTADPSAHVFLGKVFIYPSHDIDAGVKPNDLGDHFAMKDYHVLSMDSIPGSVKDNGVALELKDVPWAVRQLWAPDAAFANGNYYLYFPAKDKDDIFRIGVAVSTSPTGPFKAEPKPIEGCFSIDPAVFRNDDGLFYLYFGGIWGGQLQQWPGNKYDEKAKEPGPDEPAIGPRVAKLSRDMLHVDGQVTEIQILDPEGKRILAGDHERRYFEAPWMYRYNNKYYLMYSTGDTHLIVYATGDSPVGPFTYRGVVLNPVLGWTNHVSTVEFNGKWYLFYHDSELSGGQTHLRCVKVTELHHHSDGSIETISAYK